MMQCFFTGPLWLFSVQGHTVAQLIDALRYKVAGSIPDGVLGIFHYGPE
jgi:hypothetical protein